MDSPLPVDAPQESLDSGAAVKSSGLPAEPEEGTKSSTFSDAGDSTEPQELIQCDGCGRNFNAAAFSKHSNICAKVDIFTCVFPDRKILKLDEVNLLVIRCCRYCRISQLLKQLFSAHDLPYTERKAPDEKAIPHIFYQDGAFAASGTD